jgi:hypothetical protein
MTGAVPATGATLPTAGTALVRALESGFSRSGWQRVMLSCQRQRLWSESGTDQTAHISKHKPPELRPTSAQQLLSLGSYFELVFSANCTVLFFPVNIDANTGF